MHSFKLKILLINTGFGEKTDTINGIIGSHFDTNFQLTLGVNVFTKDVKVNGDLITMTFWDICGHNQFKFFKNTLYKGAMGLIGLINDAKSYEIIKQQIAGIKAAINKDKLPYILIGKDTINAESSLDSNKIKEEIEKDNGIYIEISDPKELKLTDNVIELARRITRPSIILQN